MRTFWIYLHTPSVLVFWRGALSPGDTFDRCLRLCECLDAGDVELGEVVGHREVGQGAESRLLRRGEMGGGSSWMGYWWCMGTYLSIYYVDCT